MNECNEELFGQFLRPIINEGSLKSMATEQNFCLTISLGSCRNYTKKLQNVTVKPYWHNARGILSSTIGIEDRNQLCDHCWSIITHTQNIQACSYNYILITKMKQSQLCSQNKKSKRFVSLAASLMLNYCVINIKLDFELENLINF